VISFDTASPVSTKGWIRNEFSKVALLNTLYNIHRITSRDSDSKRFISDAVAFYNQMNPQGFKLFQKVVDVIF
jgi:hypothetical protein